MVRLERRRVKKRLASVQFDAATNHMMHKYKYLGNDVYQCERCGIVRIDDYKHRPQYYDKNNKPLHYAGKCTG